MRCSSAGLATEMHRVPGSRRSHTAALISFRLGGQDGISVVASSMQRSLQHLGYETVTLAGEGNVDREIPGLSRASQSKLSGSQLEDALGDADLVVVENALTIPLHIAASRVLADALRERRVLVRHFDPPWHRERFAHITDFPIRNDDWVHVATCELTAQELVAHGIDAEVVRPAISEQTASVDRLAARSWVGVAEETLLALHPVRAIRRKNVGCALALAKEFRATYWLTGPAEEDFSAYAHRLIDNAMAPTIWRSFDPIGVDAAYSAADIVLFPSAWEGFGLPPLEASMRSLLPIVGNYPVAEELRQLGFEWPRPHQAHEVRQLLEDPLELAVVLDRNRFIAVREFGIEATTEQLGKVLGRRGWLPVDVP